MSRCSLFILHRPVLSAIVPGLRFWFGGLKLPTGDSRKLSCQQRYDARHQGSGFLAVQPAYTHVVTEWPIKSNRELNTLTIQCLFAARPPVWAGAFCCLLSAAAPKANIVLSSVIDAK